MYNGKDSNIYKIIFKIIFIIFFGKSIKSKSICFCFLSKESIYLRIGISKIMDCKYLKNSFHGDNQFYNNLYTLYDFPWNKQKRNQIFYSLEKIVLFFYTTSEWKNRYLFVQTSLKIQITQIHIFSISKIYLRMLALFKKEKQNQYSKC